MTGRASYKMESSEARAQRPRAGVLTGMAHPVPHSGVSRPLATHSCPQQKTGVTVQLGEARVGVGADIQSTATRVADEVVQRLGGIQG